MPLLFCQNCQSPFGLVPAYLLEKCGHSFCSVCINQFKNVKKDNHAFFYQPYVCFLCQQTSTVAILNIMLNSFHKDDGDENEKIKTKKELFLQIKKELSRTSNNENIPIDDKRKKFLIIYIKNLLTKASKFWLEESPGSINKDMLNLYLKDVEDLFPWIFFRQLSKQNLKYNQTPFSSGFAVLKFSKLEYIFDLFFQPIDLFSFLLCFGSDTVFQVRIIFFKGFQLAQLTIDKKSCIVNPSALNWLTINEIYDDNTDEEEEGVVYLPDDKNNLNVDKFYKDRKTGIIGKSLDKYNLLIMSYDDIRIITRKRKTNIISSAHDYNKQFCDKVDFFKDFIKKWKIVQYVSPN